MLRHICVCFFLLQGFVFFGISGRLCYLLPDGLGWLDDSRCLGAFIKHTCWFLLLLEHGKLHFFDLRSAELFGGSHGPLLMTNRFLPGVFVDALGLVKSTFHWLLVEPVFRIDFLENLIVIGE